MLGQFLLLFGLLAHHSLSSGHLLASNTHARLARVDTLLGLFLMGFALIHHLVHSLFQKDLKLCFLSDVTIQLRSCLFQELALIFHLLSQGFNDTFVADDFLLFTFDFAGGLVEQWTELLVRGQE
jgi:hypothetical protein